jgi:predicted CXXCH cytochrome family protein
MKFLKTSALVLVIGLLVLGALGFVAARRGFRANATPPAWEAILARSVRNFSIPAHERGQRNPFTRGSDVLQQGREFFLTECASCHGIDGSGKTGIGLNLYPRAPDLRSTSTQNLTDGELHYIIANGVQLTGMPAWNSVHKESSGDSWKLVVYIRALAQTKPPVQQQAPVTGIRYVGSESCAKCHQQIYDRWKRTPMANVIRDPRTHPDAILPNLATNNVSKFESYQVAFVYGSLWKQRFFTKVGDDYFPLPVQWDVATRAWLPYTVPSKGADWWGPMYPSDNMHRPTGPTCDGCHSVNYDIHTKQVAEWNVGCERCHGPGSDHVAHPTRDNIVNPAQMDPVAANDTCIQCHSQGQPLIKPIEGKYYDWPVGYRVGLKLQDFWKLEDCTLGQTTFYYFPDCTAHKNRMQGNDFAQSVMYRHGITCYACHDVHGTANYAQLRKPADLICLDCHGPSTPNGPNTATIEEHTHHKAGSQGSQCVACHMPAIETEGVAGAFVHAHTFRFIPPLETDKYGIPNPCTSCHKDKSTGWAEEAIRQWPGSLPWPGTR